MEKIIVFFIQCLFSMIDLLMKCNIVVFVLSIVFGCLSNIYIWLGYIVFNICDYIDFISWKIRNIR